MPQSGDIKAELSAIRESLELADKFYATGQHREAAAAYERALPLLEQTLGTMDPDTIACLQKLADSYYSCRMWGKAVPLYRRLLRIGEQILGLDHPDVRSMAAKVEDTLAMAEGRHSEMGLKQRAARLSYSSVEALRATAEPSSAWQDDQKSSQAESKKELEELQQRWRPKPEEPEEELPLPQQPNPLRPTSERARGAVSAGPLGIESREHLFELVKLYGGTVGPLVIVLGLLIFSGVWLVNLNKEEGPKSVELIQTQKAMRYATADGVRSIDVGTGKTPTEAVMSLRGMRDTMAMPFVRVGPEYGDLAKVAMSCLSKKDIWVEEVPEGLRDEHGVVYYAKNAPEQRVISQMRKLAHSADVACLGGGGYPTKKDSIELSYINPFTKMDTSAGLTFHRLETDDGRAILQDQTRGDKNLLLSLQNSDSAIWLVEPTLTPGAIHCLSVIRDYENPPGHEFYVHGCDRRGQFIQGSAPGSVFLLASRYGENLIVPPKFELPRSKSRLTRLCIVKMPIGMSSLTLLHWLFPLLVIAVGVASFIGGQQAKPAGEFYFRWTIIDFFAIFVVIIGMLWTYFLLFAP